MLNFKMGTNPLAKLKCSEIVFCSDFLSIFFMPLQYEFDIDKFYCKRLIIESNLIFYK